MAVPSDAGHIVHQGVFGSGDAVEQRGFSDIGPANKRYNGFHRVFQLNFYEVITFKILLL